MKPISYKQETGDMERICTWEPHRVLLGSRAIIILEIHAEIFS